MNSDTMSALKPFQGQLGTFTEYAVNCLQWILIPCGHLNVFCANLGHSRCMRLTVQMNSHNMSSLKHFHCQLGTFTDYEVNCLKWILIPYHHLNVFAANLGHSLCMLLTDSSACPHPYYYYYYCRCWSCFYQTNLKRWQWIFIRIIYMASKTVKKKLKETLNKSTFFNLCSKNSSFFCY